MIKADVTVRGGKADELYRRYGVAAPPAFVFVRPDGAHETVNGKLDADTFLKLMQAAR
jgi:thiol:disulfide interchange protein